MLMVMPLDLVIMDKMKVISTWNAPIKVYVIVKLVSVNVSMDTLDVHANVNPALKIAPAMVFV
jgi:hypothetical protein